MFWFSGNHNCRTPLWSHSDRFLSHLKLVTKLGTQQSHDVLDTTHIPRHVTPMATISFAFWSLSIHMLVKVQFKNVVLHKLDFFFNSDHCEYFVLNLQSNLCSFYIMLHFYYFIKIYIYITIVKSTFHLIYRPCISCFSEILQSREPHSKIPHLPFRNVSANSAIRATPLTTFWPTRLPKSDASALFTSIPPFIALNLQYPNPLIIQMDC